MIPGRVLTMATAIAWLSVSCFATATSEQTLHPEVQYGPGKNVQPKKVLALSATCGSMELKCPQSYITTVDGIVQSSMEFAGYALIDADTLRKDSGTRREEHHSEVTTHDSSSNHDDSRGLLVGGRESSGRESRTEIHRSTVWLEGAKFQDLSVTDQQVVLKRARVDGVLVARIVIGAQTSDWGPDQTVEVMVKLGVEDGFTMAWAARCSANSAQFTTVSAALEHATKCAVFGATGR